MKPLLVLLTLASLAHASPRISQISPATGLIDGTPISWDLDQDGDLDLAYLFEEEATSPTFGFPSTSASIWFENLGQRQFSPPKTLGLHFKSQRRRTSSECIIHLPTQNQTLFVASVSEPLDNKTSLFSKTIDSNSWSKLAEFPTDIDLHLPSQPTLDSPFVFTTARFDPKTVNVIDLSTSPPSQIATLALPADLDLVTNVIRPLFDFHPADLDQDGDSDLIIETSKGTMIYERINLSEFQIASPLLQISNVALADFNNDTQPDLISQSSPRQIALNQGNLQFDIEASTGLSHSPSSIFVTRLDGQTVIIEAPSSNSTALPTIQRLQPDGSFLSEPLPLTGLTNPTGLIIADFDQDGSDDLVTLARSNAPPQIIAWNPRNGNDFISPFFPILRVPEQQQAFISWGNNSDFDSLAPLSPILPLNAQSPAIGDFNNDGSPDIVVGPDTEGRAYLLLNDGSGQFPNPRLLHEIAPSQFTTEPFQIQNLLAVDFNDDGNLDLSFTISEIAVTSPPSIPSRSACAIALGRGDGTFHPVTLPLGSLEIIREGFCAISQFIDWDRDGDLDAIVDGGWRENLNGTLRESAFPLLQNAPFIDAFGNPISPSSQALGDFDGDGSPDFIIPAFRALPLDLEDPFVGSFLTTFHGAIAFNTGNGNLTNLQEIETDLIASDALGNPFTFPYFALDLDLDGRAELIYAEPSSDALGNPIYQRYQRLIPDPISPRDLSLAQVFPIPTFSPPMSDTLVDFNGDLELEYAAADQFVTPTTRGPLISPRYSFIGDHLQDYPFAAVPAPVALADFDNDGDLDALYARDFSGLYLVRNTIIDEDSPIPSFLAGNNLTPAQADPTGDPDQDGRNNALELLQFTDPLTADQAPTEFILPIITSNATQLLFNMRDDAESLALHYDLETSTDLTNWTRVTTPNPQTISVVGLTRRVSLPLPQNQATRYFRIKASHDPRR